MCGCIICNKSLMMVMLGPDLGILLPAVGSMITYDSYIKFNCDLSGKNTLLNNYNKKYSIVKVKKTTTTIVGKYDFNLNDKLSPFSAVFLASLLFLL